MSLLLLACAQPAQDTSHVPAQAWEQARTARLSGPVVLDQPYASTAWWEASSTPGGWGGDYLASETAEVSDPALFVFELDQARCVHVEAWWTDGPNRSRAATFIGRTEKGQEVGRVSVDQRRDGARWVSLGSWDFPSGRSAIALSRWAPGDVVIADAVRLSPCGVEVAQAEVELLSPVQGALVQNPVTFELDGAGLDRVVLDADGWVIADWDPSAEGWSATYSFNGTGTPRLVTATGYDAEGQVVAEDTVTITVEGPAARDVPYRYQYDNAYEPASTCGLTSASMLLGSLGSKRSPDSLYLAYGKGQGQSPEGLAQLYRWEGYDADSGRTATRQDLKRMLDEGLPVVVHGTWTGAGHIAVLVDYDGSGWIVNDPAGDWYQGYGSSWGEQVRYPFGSQWDQRLSWDGDIWWSTAW